MNFARVEEIASAVLYEGYMLYPYRPSSVKNQQRWNFGVLCPESYCALEPGSESSFMQTQCLLKCAKPARLVVKLRFLQIVQRSIGRYAGDGTMSREYDAGGLEFVDRLDVDGRVFRPWQEAMEQQIICAEIEPASCGPRSIAFNFPGGESFEQLRDVHGSLVGAIMRHWQTLEGSVRIETEPCGDDAIRLTVRVDNRSKFDAAAESPSFGRDAALLYSLVSTHIILGAEDGEFLSSLDPPAGFKDAVTQCENVGAWPVLAGDDTTTVLASPIILYDYPQIAPESPGNLFDGTEIDEILSLRILTLTDQEKAEIRESDDRARDLLERTESIPAEQFMKLHGVLRGLTTLKEEPE